MPEITVQIEWDTPDDPFWLNPGNVALALHAYCKNTKFQVRWPTFLTYCGECGGPLCSECGCSLLGKHKNWCPTKEKMRSHLERETITVNELTDLLQEDRLVEGMTWGAKTIAKLKEKIGTCDR